MRAESVGRQGESPASDDLGLFDFCRGVAVLMVVLVHAHRGWFGWEGVHVFVVLSGFGLTYARMRRGTAESWGAWFGRRFKRLLPAYSAAAGAGFIVAAAVARLRGDDLGEPTVRLALDLALLRNLSYRTMLADPNSALWYVPFAATLYVAFPPLYACLMRVRGPRGYVLVGLGAVAVELGYRAAAILWLDGWPVAFGHGFLPAFGSVGGALDRLSPEVPFQLWAPFGFAPSRIGEFALGGLAAVAYCRHRDAFRGWLWGPPAVALAVLLWLAGNALVYAGPPGWVAADAAIAVGGTLALVRLAATARSGWPAAFRAASALGRVSYYLFLSHLVVGYAQAAVYEFLPDTPLPTALLLLVATVAGIVVASWVLLRLDRAVAGTTAATGGA